MDIPRTIPRQSPGGLFRRRESRARDLICEAKDFSLAIDTKWARGAAENQARSPNARIGP